MTRSRYINSRAEGDAITERESEVLKLVAKGWQNKNIAHALGVNETTIKAHVGSMLIKLGADNRVQLALHFHNIEWK